MIRRIPILSFLLFAIGSCSVWLLSGSLPLQAQPPKEPGQSETTSPGATEEPPDAGEKATRYSLVQAFGEDGKYSGAFLLDTRTGRLWRPDNRLGQLWNPDNDGADSWAIAAESPQGGKEGSYQFLGRGGSYLLNVGSGELWALGPKGWVQRFKAPKK